jgi:hypothetical protein
MLLREPLDPGTGMSKSAAHQPSLVGEPEVGQA